MYVLEKLCFHSDLCMKNCMAKVVRGACCMWLRLTAVSWEIIPGVVAPPVTASGPGCYRKDGIRVVSLGYNYSLVMPLLGVGL